MHFLGKTSLLRLVPTCYINHFKTWPKDAGVHRDTRNRFSPKHIIRLPIAIKQVLMMDDCGFALLSGCGDRNSHFAHRIAHKTRHILNLINICETLLSPGVLRISSPIKVRSDFLRRTKCL